LYVDNITWLRQFSKSLGVVPLSRRAEGLNACLGRLIFMLIVLHGDDNFRSRQKLIELQKAYLQKNAQTFNFERFDATVFNFQELKNIFEAQSLFLQKRFIIVENILENKVLKEELSKYDFETTTGISEVPIVVIFYERASVVKDKDYKKILKRATKAQEFKKLSPRQAIDWFYEFFESQGKKLERNIIQKVFDLCQQDLRKETGGTSMWQTNNELGKLYSYKRGSAITQRDLEILQIGTPQAQIFPTIDAIFSGNQDRAFYNVLLYWTSGEHPQILFNMIEMQLKNIALVKEALGSYRFKRGPTPDLASRLGLHPFVVKKTSALVDKFSWNKIKNLYARVESLDIKNKTGQLDSYLATELLVAAVLA